LFELARALGCEEIFPIPEGLGGRFSVLSAVGLLPGAIMGLDVLRLLELAGRTDLPVHRGADMPLVHEKSAYATTVHGTWWSDDPPQAPWGGFAKKTPAPESAMDFLVRTVLARPGDHVAAGQPLVRFRNTDLEMQITAVADAPAKAGPPTTVSARKLHDLLRALPDDATLNVDVTGSRMTVRAGRSRFNLQTLAAGDYPRISLGHEKLQSLSIAQKDLRALFRLVEFAMAQQDIRYYLNGLLLVVEDKSLKLVATDGHRLAYAAMALESKLPRQEVIVPRKTVAELAKLAEDGDGDVRIELSPSKIRVTTARVVLTSKLIDGTFPDYERVIPQGNDKTMEVDNHAFAEAVDRVSTLSSDKGRAVKLSITDGKLTLSVNNPDSGSASEELPVEYGFDPLEIGFNARYLLDISGQLEGGTAEFQLADPGSPTMIRDGKDVSALYVLMPMRV